MVRVTSRVMKHALRKQIAEMSPLICGYFSRLLFHPLTSLINGDILPLNPHSLDVPLVTLINPFLE